MRRRTGRSTEYSVLRPAHHSAIMDHKAPCGGLNGAAETRQRPQDAALADQRAVDLPDPAYQWSAFLVAQQRTRRSAAAVLRADADPRLGREQPRGHHR